MPERRGSRYWGPVLVVLGVIAVLAASAALSGTALYWAVVAGIVLALSGVITVAYRRL